MNSLSCSKCLLPIQDGNHIKPCDCDKYYHNDCLNILEKENYLILNRKCFDCHEYYNIDFKSKVDEFLYKFYSIYDLIYINSSLVVYLIGLIVFIWDKILSLLIVSNINLINLLLFSLTYFKIYRELSKSILLNLVITSILIAITLLYDINIWLVISFYIFNLNIARTNKTYEYLFSTRYHYIKIYNSARLN